MYRDADMYHPPKKKTKQEHIFRNAYQAVKLKYFFIFCVEVNSFAEKSSATCSKEG